MGVIKELTICSKKLKKDVTYVLVASDFHIELNYGIENLEVISSSPQVDYGKLDYILMPGDIVNDVNQLEDERFKRHLQDTLYDFTKNKPTFVSLGNHDQMTKDENGKWKLGKKKLIINTLEELPNFTLLKNNELPIEKDGFSFAAYSPRFNYYEGKKENKELYRRKFYANYQEFPEDTYNVFLTHEPQSIIKLSEKSGRCIQENADLVVSGHMHNGLMPTSLHKYFKNYGFLSPQMSPFPKYAQGEYKVGDTNFIINGPVNARVEMPIFNDWYGASASVITLKKVR